MSGCADLEQHQQALAASQAALSSCQSNFASLESESDARREEMKKLDATLQSLANNTADLAELCTDNAPAAPPAPPPAATAKETPAKLIVGRRESIWVEDLQLALPARIDTGAETASLDARALEQFERDGKPWVRFEIPNPNGDEALVLERPRIRQALVVQANSETPERRPVIELGIQLGPVRQLAEFTLSDRSHLDYQMLVGRNILRDVMIVDVSESNLVPPPDTSDNEGVADAP